MPEVTIRIPERFRAAVIDAMLIEYIRTAIMRAFDDRAPFEHTVVWLGQYHPVHFNLVVIIDVRHCVFSERWYEKRNYVADEIRKQIRTKDKLTEIGMFEIRLLTSRHTTRAIYVPMGTTNPGPWRLYCPSPDIQDPTAKEIIAVEF